MSTTAPVIDDDNGVILGNDSRRIFFLVQWQIIDWCNSLISAMRIFTHPFHIIVLKKIQHYGNKQ